MDVLKYGDHEYCASSGWSLKPWDDGHYVKLDLELFVRLNRERRAARA